MTDSQYFGLYSSLVSKLQGTGEFDGDIFYTIFEGKIRPIIYNAFNEHRALFSFFDTEDVCQDLFIILWKKSAPCYFLSDKYENDPVWYLAWCKIVCTNYVTSLLRKHSLKGTESVDDPDRPSTVGNRETGFDSIVYKETVSAVYRFTALLSAKVEMKLVWYCIYNLIYSGACENKISANRVFLEKCPEKTLGQLYSEILSCTEDIGMPIGDEGEKKMEKELSENVGGKPHGNAVVGELLGERPAAKISDWVYKINKKLSEEMPQEVTKWNI